MSIEKTLEERSTTHGDFQANARVAQRIKAAMRAEAEMWNALPVTEREALDMIAHKMARVVASGGGAHRTVDHWRDIAGYAKLAKKAVAQLHGSVDVLAVRLAHNGGTGRWSLQVPLLGTEAAEQIERYYEKEVQDAG